MIGVDCRENRSTATLSLKCSSFAKSGLGGEPTVGSLDRKEGGESVRWHEGLDPCFEKSKWIAVLLSLRQDPLCEDYCDAPFPLHLPPYLLDIEPYQ